MKSLSRVRLFATPWTSPPGSSDHGILQVRVLEWVAISFSRDLPGHHPNEKKQKLFTQSSATARASTTIRCIWQRVKDRQGSGKAA